MTRELVREAVLVALEDMAGENLTVERQADSITKSIETALRIQERMSSGLTPRLKPAAIQSNTTEQPDVPITIPTPPANAEASMIVLPGAPPPSARPQLIKPGDPGFSTRPTSDVKKPEAARPPIRVSSLSGPVRVKDNWKIEKLVAALHEQMPETLDIIPHGKTTSIRLMRNIEAAAPAGAAKAVYTITGMSPDQPGVQGKMDQSTGHVDGTVVAARIGRYVSKTFFVTDPLDLGVEAAVETLCEQARDVFKERSRELFSNTPRRTGHMRYDMKETPHPEDQDRHPDYAGI